MRLFACDADRDGNLGWGRGPALKRFLPSHVSRPTSPAVAGRLAIVIVSRLTCRSTQGVAVAVVARFEIEYLQYLDADGKPVRDDLPELAKDIKQLVELYKLMS